VASGGSVSLSCLACPHWRCKGLWDIVCFLWRFKWPRDSACLLWRFKGVWGTGRCRLSAEQLLGDLLLSGKGLPVRGLTCLLWWPLQGLLLTKLLTEWPLPGPSVDKTVNRMASPRTFRSQYWQQKGLSKGLLLTKLSNGLSEGQSLTKLSTEWPFPRRSVDKTVNRRPLPGPSVGKTVNRRASPRAFR
jgi:hypothetical protein